MPLQSLWNSSMDFFCSSSPITITKKELDAFHNIDRDLYTRLIVNLASDPSKSIQVMALWLWYERIGYENHLIFILSAVADHVLNDLFKESVLVLQCLETDEFSVAMETNNDLPSTKHFTKSILTLRYFFDNRRNVGNEVDRLAKEVCFKAFEDIYEHYSGTNVRGNVSGHGPMIVPMFPAMQYPEQQFVPQNFGHFIEGGFNNYYVPNPSYNPGIQQGSLEVNNMNVQVQNLNNMCDNVSSLNINAMESTYGSGDSSLDARTIFLTFSKGYPISEKEVTEYFTRRFKGCIEAIHMQEVQSPRQQPLYAKLIVYTPEKIESVLGKKNKAKFTINGKHTWARKFVRKDRRFRS